MSHTTGYGAAMIATKQSQLAQVLIGSKSLYQQRGMQATTPVHCDDTVYILPIDNNITPAWVAGARVRFALPKTSTLIGRAWLEIALAAGSNAVGGAYTPGVPFNPVTGAIAVAPIGTPSAAYCKNFGDLIIEQDTLRYGSNVLQQYNTEFQVMLRRLAKNDVNIEDVNSNVFGALPPGGAAELVLADAFYSGCTVRRPLDELFWTSSKDEHWMPESLALEGELICQFRGIGEVVYTADQNAPATLPTITDVRLRYQEITLSAAEKENRLKLYKTPEGSVVHFLDVEQQLGFVFTGAAAAHTVNIPLSNFRMDMAEIVFMVRVLENEVTTAQTPGYRAPIANVNGQLQLWGGSRMESLATPSLVTGASVACIVPITQFKLSAAGKDIYVYQPEFYNRSYVRKQYHPDSQIADGIYVISFAAFPEDRKNATGHQSASVLGQLNLAIDMPATSTALRYQVDVYSHSHNLIQSRAGGIAKALH
jgi:hypothetical protein